MGSVAASFMQQPDWYKDAIIYQLHVKSFFDANNDGIGDFEGLISKLDYIDQLGANTIWLLPFYPSPRRDDGYDIAAYRAVHPDYGDMATVKRFIREAHARGIRVITELVVNHTSDQHPWFQRARHARPGSAARDFYVWSDSDHKYSGTRIIFCDTESSNWSWDAEAKAYYWHRFYSHQPDLNYDNPRVIKAVLGAMRFWLNAGVDGLRLDAVPYLIEREGTNNENLPETHQVLKAFRAELEASYPGRMLLAEANQWPEDAQQYFGDGDECHMAFHFPLMPRMYMALAQEDRYPITDILRQTPDIPASCQWAIFLRNHDELTLEMVTDRERDYLWDTYASDRRARINLGIRRRLAPLLDFDRRRVELLNSLLLSMPGTPVIYYGDEIFMGDNIYLGDRDGVRTPMQWSPDRNGGFSRADPARLVLPPIMDPLSGFAAVNVEAQGRDQHSLLNWMRRLLDVRKRQHVFGRGWLKLLAPSNRRILAYLRGGSDGEDVVLCVANMAKTAQAVELDLAAYVGQVPVEMIGGAAFPPIGQLPYLLTLTPYGFYWFLLVHDGRLPSWHVRYPESMPELMTLVVRNGVRDPLTAEARARLEHDILPSYLPMRRWFAAKDDVIDRVSITLCEPLPVDGCPLHLVEIEVTSSTESGCYLLPLALIDEGQIVGPLPQQLALSRFRSGRSVGFLTDAFSVGEFAIGLIRSMQQQVVWPFSQGEVRCIGSQALEALLPETSSLEAIADVRWLGVEQSNSSLVVAERFLLKLFRRLQPGPHPEAEMARVLTARGYRHIPPLLGAVQHIDADGAQRLLALLQGYVPSQGDAWTWVLNVLEQLQQGEAMPGDDSALLESGALWQLLSDFSASIGRHLAEMHLALAEPTDEPEFSPETAQRQHVDQWVAGVQRDVERALQVVQRLTESQAETPEREDAAVGAQLLASRQKLLDEIELLAEKGLDSPLIRIHGDLHLGQILVVQQEAMFLDFEGEPARPLEERVRKSSPLRDVAGVLRSIDYAAATSVDRDGDIGRAVAERFRERAANSFLEGYHAAGGDWIERWPPQTLPSLLRLFLIEKAAYEVVYEAANRPSWIGVPLRGLAKLANEAGTAREGG